MNPNQHNLRILQITPFDIIIKTQHMSSISRICENPQRSISLRASSKSSNSHPPNQIVFLSYQEEQQRSRKALSKREELTRNNCPMEGPISNEQFTQQERQNLKNAFRYICRLAFKQSAKYTKFISKLITKHKNTLPAEAIVQNQTNMMVNDAETISGQRYFKQYMHNLSLEDQRIVLQYMIWFLKWKYLRYIKKTESEKGKRKCMKKQLYLRFKNEVMLPYMIDLLEQRDS